MRAIFRSTTQALHFAYLIQAYEASVESAMGSIVRRRLMELGISEGTREESSVSFDGLNALEVRGQCAMIRLAVESLLPAAESWAIKARYGLTNIVERPGQVKAYVFAEERIVAMRALSAYFAPVYSSIPSGAIIWLIAKSCGELEAIRPSFRDIEEHFGGSLGALHKAYHGINKTLRTLEQAGIDRLHPLFIREGVVQDMSAA